MKNLSHLPVFVDPSHATGRVELVRPMSLSAIIAGCDGLEIEVHPDPKNALSDNSQQLLPDAFAGLMDDIRATLEFKEKALAK